jgi:hypothetical protein
MISGKKKLEKSWQIIDNFEIILRKNRNLGFTNLAKKIIKK